MNQREFTAVYQKHGKWTLAWIEEIPGVNTQGHTLKEAKENLKEALQMVLEANRALTLGKMLEETRKESLRIAIPA